MVYLDHHKKIYVENRSIKRYVITNWSLLIRKKEINYFNMCIPYSFTRQYRVAYRPKTHWPRDLRVHSIPVLYMNQLYHLYAIWLRLIKITLQWWGIYLFNLQHLWIISHLSRLHLTKSRYDFTALLYFQHSDYFIEKRRKYVVRSSYKIT